MKTKLRLTLLCLSLCSASLFAQQRSNEHEPKVTITKKITEPDGTSVTETTVKKGDLAKEFDIDAYIKENKADNVDIDIRSDVGDEERYISIHGSEGPRSTRYKSVGDDIARDVERAQMWVEDQVQAISTSKSNYSTKAFFGVEEDSDEKEDEPGLVVEVVRNSAADLAGLRDNDKILSLNGQKTDHWEDLTNFMQNAKKGDVVKVVYERNGMVMTTEATLTTRNEVKPASAGQPRGYLGVSDSYDNDKDSGKKNRGVKVNIVNKSAAEKAGLKDGDRILQLNDTEINDFEDIEDFMKYIHPDDQIKVKFDRDGKTETIEVKAGKSSSWDWGQIDLKESNIDIRTKEACMGVYNGVEMAGDRKGASIVNFTPNSGAKKAGMEVGDIILSVAGERVQTCDDLWNALASFKPNEKVNVEYARDGKDFVVAVTLNTCNDASSMVKIYDADEEGNSSERQFYSSVMDEDDAEKFIQMQTITVHKSGLGDVPVINATSGNESNPVMKERSLKLERFSVSPLPTNGPLTVEFKAPPVPTEVTLYDLSGHQLFQEELNIFNGKYLQQFDLSEFSKGGVLLRIRQGDKFYSEQILIN